VTRPFVGQHERVRYLPESRIEADAEALLDEWKAKGWARSVPVPLDDIVEFHLELGLIVEDLGTPDVLGLILFGDRTIKVNSTLDPKINPRKLGRYNFTEVSKVSPGPPVLPDGGSLGYRL